MIAVELPVLPPPVDQLWHVLLDLGRELDVPWALIGGQMVLLHAIEQGQVPPQVSQDGDVIADIRAVPGALTRVVAGLAVRHIEAAPPLALAPPRPADVRRWASAHGLVVSDRGRIPAAVMDQHLGASARGES